MEWQINSNEYFGEFFLIPTIHVSKAKDETKIEIVFWRTGLEISVCNVNK